MALATAPQNGLSKDIQFSGNGLKGDCFVTGFCEARCSLRSGNAPQKLASEGSRRPRESINHRSLSTPFIAGAIGLISFSCPLTSVLRFEITAYAIAGATRADG